MMKYFPIIYYALSTVLKMSYLILKTLRLCTRDNSAEEQMLQNLQKASRIVVGPDFKTRAADQQSCSLSVCPMPLPSGL